MSKLSTLINNARAGLSIQQSIPGARWDAIAKQCGTEEIEEIRARIIALKDKLATVEEWDGDTQDGIHVAISRFSHLLELADTPSAAQEGGISAAVPLKRPWWTRWKD